MLRCAEGYWSNWGSIWGAAAGAEPLMDQRCTDDNCKTWAHATASGLPSECQTCWDENDIAGYGTWAARGSYTPQEIEFRDGLGFENVENVCKLNCLPNYWSNWDSTHLPAEPKRDQRCTSYNCKAWAHDPPNVAKTSNVCSECWDWSTDIDNYDTWDARSKYTKQEIAGAHKTTPFTIDPTTNICALQCAAGWWSNFGSTWNWGVTFEKLDQRCTSDNCKDWNYEDGVDPSTKCSQCWKEADINDWPNWDARGSYTLQKMFGRLKTSEAFLLVGGQCT